MSRNAFGNVAHNYNDLVAKFEFINNLPGLILVKDVKSKYLSITSEWSYFIGWKSSIQCIYKTDYDVPCKATELASKFIDCDKKVMNSGQNLLTLEIINYSTGWKGIMCNKSPLRDTTGEIIGVFCQGLDVSNVNVFTWYTLLNCADQQITSTFNKSAVYTLGPAHSPLPLTQRQQACVFWLIRGKPMKEIAYILKISDRTVQTHLEAIKHRLGCYTKGQIIEKAIDAGFLYYIPEEFLKKYKT